MTRDGDRLAAFRSLLSLPPDLAAVVAAVVLTFVVSLVPILNETALRVLVGLSFVLFAPGYAFIAALFPEQGSEEAGIDGLERTVLSLGSSIAIVPLVGLALNFTPWGIRLLPILFAVGGLTLGLVAVAAVRRDALPPTERFTVPYRSWIGDARTALLRPSSRTDALLNVVLALSVVLAAASVAYAVAVPTQSEPFTEFYLLTESPSGELVADNYPTEFSSGQGRNLVFGVVNHEHEPITYTVVIELQRVTIENGSVTVREDVLLGRYSRRLAENETWHEPHTVTPTMTGLRLRLQYLLYTGDVPSEPRAETAYRTTHLWVNVTQMADRRDTFFTGRKF